VEDESQYFKVNNRPLKLPLSQNEPEEVSYISSFITRFNPDLLIPGGALAGNQYFKKKLPAEGDAEENQVEEGEMKESSCSDVE
jgi:hypothetical protein